MNQTESDQQLQIWKDLAISKQMLMNEAASSLKLKADWTQEDLKEALETAIKRGNEAEENMTRTRTEADDAVTDMRTRLEAAEKAKAVADAARTEAENARQQAEQQLANGRKDNAEALKRAKQQVADKDRELKAINSALADTPANVLKKLKNLKRQKHEEAQARTKAEDANRKLKKDNKALEEKNEEQQALADKGSEIAAAYKTLLEFSEKQNQSLKDAGVDVEDLPQIDAMLLSAFDQDDESEDSEDTVAETVREAAHA